GIAGFEVERREYLGSAMNVPRTPRHLAMTPNGRVLLVTSNVSGYLSQIDVDDLITVLTQARGKRSQAEVISHAIDLGEGARTVDISPDGALAFVALNNMSRVGIVSTADFSLLGLVEADPFPVGL